MIFLRKYKVGALFVDKAGMVIICRKKQATKLFYSRARIKSLRMKMKSKL